MCDLAPRYVWHALFTGVTWLIHTCARTHSHVWHKLIVTHTNSLWHTRTHCERQRHETRPSSLHTIVRDTGMRLDHNCAPSHTPLCAMGGDSTHNCALWQHLFTWVTWCIHTCDINSSWHTPAADRDLCATTRFVYVYVHKDPSHVQRDVSFVKREPFKNKKT